MASKDSSKPVGVLGAGSFGTSVANLLAENSEVLLYARRPEVVEEIGRSRKSAGYDIHDRINPTNNLEEVIRECDVIFPVISSQGLREMIKKASPFLRPYHILIHGTKGLDLEISSQEKQDDTISLSRQEVKTMSEVINEESVVIRVGCLAGPNLAKELMQQQPAATVIASEFDEVIETGQALLKNDRFQVYGNKDLIGIELAGVLKNIIAIASGAVTGLGFGENAKGLLISRGMLEMIHLGGRLGGNVEAFMGLAGVGDLVATCSSRNSRNFTVGYRLAQGETLAEILESMEEVAEGVNTVRIAKRLCDYYKIKAPITETLYNVLYKDMTILEALDYLMKYPTLADVIIRRKS